MICRIVWNSLSLPEWQDRFAKIARSNLLQSYDYARASCPLYRQKARWGLIEIDGAEAGLVQVFEAGVLGNMLHAVILDRGPLWFNGFGGPEHLEAFFREFARQFPRRFGRRRRVIPEHIDAPEVRAVMARCGYRRLDRPGYQTVWLDLRNDMEMIRKNMRKNWRNALTTAERASLTVDWTNDNAAFSLLLTNYQSDKMKKGYDGPSPRLLRALAGSFAGDNMVIGRAQQEGGIVAEVLFFRHGRTATYQVGWSAEEGRKTAAHNFLLWQAVEFLKTKGIDFLDLGGTNDDTAKGVKTFKEGMGGESVTLAGHYT